MKRGPKPKNEPRVVFYRRVHPDLIPALESVLSQKDCEVVSAATKDVQMACNAKETAIGGIAESELVEQLGLERARANGCQLDVDRLTAEKLVLQSKLDRCAAADLDQKGNWWRIKFLELQAKTSGNGEFDQTAG